MDLFNEEGHADATQDYGQPGGPIALGARGSAHQHPRSGQRQQEQAELEQAIDQWTVAMGKEEDLKPLNPVSGE